MNGKEIWKLQISIDRYLVEEIAIEGTVLDAKARAGDISWWLNSVLERQDASVRICRSNGEQVARLQLRPPEPLVKRSSEAIREIALQILGIDQLQDQDDDRKDFRQLAVWNIRAALLEAFKAGTVFGREAK